MKKTSIPHGWMRAIVFIFIYILSMLAVGLAIMVVLLLIKLSQNGSFANSMPAVKEMMGNMIWLIVIMQTLTAMLSVWFARKVIDKQSFLSLGFAWKGFETYAYTGIFGAIAMLGFGTIVLVLLKYLSFTDITFDGIALLNGAAMMVLVAFTEELIFRGYLLNNLMQSMNKWIALPITAFAFALMHLSNPGMTVISFFEIFIAGIMLGVNYIYTKNLWFGILLHFVWNYMQGSLLGYQVSGINLTPVLHQSLNGPTYLTGGVFGFEGSILSMVMNMIFTGVLVTVYEKGTKRKKVVF